MALESRKKLVHYRRLKNSVFDARKMGPILFAVFCAILANSCDSSEVEEPNVNLFDLDDRALYLIIDELSFVDTINLASLHPTLSDVANDVFRDKKTTDELNIMSHILAPHMSHRPIQDHQYGQTGPIRVSKVPTALRILETFGSAIGKISINYNYIKLRDRITITRFLNKHTAKTVKYLELRPINQAVLNELKTPFKQLEDLNVGFHSQRPGSSKRWNHLFPKIQRLSLTISPVSVFDLVDCQFPRLKHLGLRISKPAWSKADQIENLVKVNPTVESVELDSFYTQAFVDRMLEHLPKLENLTLSSWYIEGDSVKIENVKNLNVATSNAKTINKLTLPRLESIQMHYSSNHSEKWVEFFAAHPQLLRLHMVESFTSNELPLNNFTMSLPNLNDVTFLYTTKIPLDNIITFIDNHAALQQFSFAYQVLEVLVKEFENDTKKLKERYGENWTIKDFGYEGNKGLVFTRKERDQAE